MNINIFIRQFRSSNEDIIEMIKDGEHDDFGAEKLKGLMKILPQEFEIEKFKNFSGDKSKDKSKLGDADRFVVEVIEIKR